MTASTATMGPRQISVADEIATLTFLPDRSPTTTARESGGSFRELAGYRDGGVFVAHWAGTSEWERHNAGDEVVMVVEGATTIFFLADGEERSAPLGPGELVVVPQGTWHRFETPGRVAMLSVTPQPTDHRAVRPT